MIDRLYSTSKSPRLTSVWETHQEVKGQTWERDQKVMTGAGETVTRQRMKALELDLDSIPSLLLTMCAKQAVPLSEPQCPYL